MSNAYPRRIAGLILGALAAVSALPALAADYPYPSPAAEPGPIRIDREEVVEEQITPPPPPRAEPLDGPRFSETPRFAPLPPPAEECRTVVKRRVDFDGSEIERRVRVCDEAPYARPRPRYRPSFYGTETGLVPPADIPDERW